MSDAGAPKLRLDTRPKYDPKEDWPGGIGYRKGTVLEGKSGWRYKVQEDGSLRRIRS